MKYKTLIGIMVILLLPTMASAQSEFNELIKNFEHTNDLAREGDVNAHFKLGEMYRTGNGVPKNVMYSVVWYSIAKTLGHSGIGFKELKRQQNGLREYGSFIHAQTLAVECFSSHFKNCPY